MGSSTKNFIIFILRIESKNTPVKWEEISTPRRSTNTVHINSIWNEMFRELNRENTTPNMLIIHFLKLAEIFCSPAFVDILSCTINWIKYLRRHHRNRLRVRDLHCEEWTEVHFAKKLRKLRTNSHKLNKIAILLNWPCFKLVLVRQVYFERKKEIIQQCLHIQNHSWLRCYKLQSSMSRHSFHFSHPNITC